MDQYIGRLLDNRYEILEVIGTGGMAVVYKARCHRLNRLVAIKILKDEFARDEEFRRRFHAEGEAVAMLSHPNIVQVYDVSSSETANYIVMELIDGISLKQYMEKKGVLNWKETLHFAMQIAKGLEHAHSRGIVHRDIKPHNVMVLKNGSVKVMDFGIARVMNKSNTLTKEALGSVHYISPEQAKGGYTDSRSDIYSLSVVMYEMMTGRPPYDGDSAVAVAIQHINGGAPMPSTLNPNIPGGLEQIIMKGMALDVNDRYASATEMLQDMEEFRKNPAILFHYKTVLDDATRTISGIPVSPGVQPKATTADRVVQSKTGVRPRTAAPTDSVRLRQTGGVPASGGSARQTGSVPASGGSVRKTGSTQGTAGRSTESARRAQQRRREEEERREEERSRMTTVAIVVCSAVAVVAIIVFMVALFNGSLLNKEQELVQVPNLLGDTYSDELAQRYSDFTIILQPQEYSKEYGKGKIMAQAPVGGSKVIKGTELYITISMGEEPEEKIMEDILGTTMEQADSFLRGQGYVPLFRDESNDTYPAGKVCRTDPEAGEPLTEGQTICVWLSTGPEPVLEKMPNVVGKDKDTAVKTLNDLGFAYVSTQEVESNEKQGTVVKQSENEGREIDVTTEIVLDISKGPEEASEPSSEATESQAPPESEDPVMDTATVTVTFPLPEKEAPYVLSIRMDGQNVIEPRTIDGDTSISLSLTNSGTKTIELYIDGEFYRSQDVPFTNG